MIKVSVVIATYNTAAYLEECLKSIFAQTLREIEIIIIDDGSTDNTRDIIKKYINLGKNIIYKYQENQGAGIARNYGISLVTGEFMIFMDPDDIYPNTDCIEKLYLACIENNVEICGGTVLTINGSQIKVEYKAGNGIENHTVNEVVKAKSFNYLYGHQRYMFKTLLIKANNITYAAYKRYEDQVFTIKALGIAQRFFELDYPVYAKRINYRDDSWWEINVYTDIFKGFRDTLKLILQYDFEMMFINNYPSFIELYFPRICQFAYNGNDEFDRVIDDINDIVKGSKYFEEEYLISENRVKKYRNSIKEEIEAIKNILKAEKKIIIYGAGQYTKKFVKEYKNDLRNVIGIAVSQKKKDENEICGIKIAQITDYLGIKEDVFVIITPGGNIKNDIIQTLNDLNFLRYRWIDVNKVYKG